MFDPNKPIRTTDGRPARVVDHNFRTYPSGPPRLLVICEQTSGAEMAVTVDPETGIDVYDFVRRFENIPQRIQRTYYLNIYRNGGAVCFKSPQDALSAVDHSGTIPTATAVPVAIDVEEGYKP